ncbi:MAG TPA: hypothetical protein VG929_09920 [Actinomycetota bacterium]|nr:hypothetical protein [Actinomycetota bacterium]
MTRDWSPLAGSDPIPGDPDAIGALVRRLTSTSNGIKRQADRLRGLDTSGWWKGLAADAFVRRQRKLPPLLDDVAQRYDEVAEALGAYRPDLETAQAMALEALFKAKAAEAAIERAQQGLIEMQQHEYAQNARVSSYSAQHPKQPPIQPAPWAGPNWHSELQYAQEDMEAARALLDNARSLRDEAAGRAAGRISNAIDDALKNEGGFSAYVKRRWKTFTEEVLPVIAGIVEFAATVLAVASLIFPVLAPFAVIAGALVLGLSLLKVATGQGSWGDVGMAVFGVATGGLGRLVGRFAKAGRAIAATGRATGIASSGILGRITATTGRLVSGAAARSTAVKQFKVVAEHYSKGSRGFFPAADEFSKAVEALRTPQLLRASTAERIAGFRGRIDPAIADSVPHVVSRGDIAPVATFLTRVTFARSAYSAGKGVHGQVEKFVTGSPQEQALDRAKELDPIPVTQ